MRWLSVINVLNSKGENRWIVASSNLNPVIPVMKYVKSWSLGPFCKHFKTDAYHLKLYWSFLEIKNLNYDSIDLNVLAEFISWLRHPKGSINLTYVNATQAKRSEKTINQIVNYVIGIYDYMTRREYFDKGCKNRSHQGNKNKK